MHVLVVPVLVETTGGREASLLAPHLAHPGCLTTEPRASWLRSPASQFALWDPLPPLPVAAFTSSLPRLVGIYAGSGIQFDPSILKVASPALYSLSHSFRPPKRFWKADKIAGQW